jgi:hypothetical protein
MRKYKRAIRYYDTEEKISVIASKLKIGDHIKFAGEKEISEYLVVGLYQSGEIKEYGLMLLKSNWRGMKYLNTIGLTCSDLNIILNCYFQCLDGA